MLVDSRNEWDPLESIVVGSALKANWPSEDPVFATESSRTSWTETPVPSGPVPQKIIDETEEDLLELCEVLVRAGVQVYRPKPMDFRIVRGMYNYCPRDRVLIAGSTAVDCNMMYPCRDIELYNLPMVTENAKRVLMMPRNQGMTLDAANVCRLGKDWLFLESHSGNRAAYDWLCEQFPKINIELCNFYSGVHIDSTVVPLRQGLVLLNGSRVNQETLPKVFQKDWHYIFIEDVVAQDFYQYPYASKWIAMNMLVIDPHTVICDRNQPNLIKLLESLKFDVIPLELRHSRTLGGGFHCVTLDLRRRHA